MSCGSGVSASKASSVPVIYFWVGELVFLFFLHLGVAPGLSTLSQGRRFSNRGSRAVRGERVITDNMCMITPAHD